MILTDMPCRGLAALMILGAAPASSDVVAPGGRVIDCYCTDTGGNRVELGQTICLFVDGRAFMAQCQMSLNVPMWREVAKGCLSSQAPGGVPGSTPARLPDLEPQRLQPAGDPGAVDIEIALAEP